jgi:hypothetical protein
MIARSNPLPVGHLAKPVVRVVPAAMAQARTARARLGQIRAAPGASLAEVFANTARLAQVDAIVTDGLPKNGLAGAANDFDTKSCADGARWRAVMWRRLGFFPRAKMQCLMWVLHVSGVWACMHTPACAATLSAAWVKTGQTRSMSPKEQAGCTPNHEP